MRTLAWAAALALVPTAALAQSPVDLNTEFFRPAPGKGFFEVQEARVLPNLDLALGATFNFAQDPLVAFDNNGDVALTPVEAQAALDVAIALGLFDFAEIGAVLPLAVVQQGEDLGLIGGGAAISGSSLGDL